MGLKPSDYQTVPLDSRQHMLLHNGGEKTFWKTRQIDPDRHILSQLLLYLTMKAKSDPRSAIDEIAEVVWRLTHESQGTNWSSK